MSRFNNAARRVCAHGGPTSGWDWIAFHRCVEAYCRTTGERFGDVFDRMKRDHGVARGRALPAPSALRAAVADLRARRDARLERDAADIIARRAAKRAGRRRPDPGLLDDREQDRRRANQLWPRVGLWGWRRLRDGAFGDPVAHEAGVFDVRADRGWMTLSVPGATREAPDAHAVRTLAQTVRGPNLVTLHFVIRVPSATWDAWCDADPSAVVDALRPLERVTVGRRTVQVTGAGLTRHPVSDLERALRARRWAVASVPDQR